VQTAGRQTRGECITTAVRRRWNTMASPPPFFPVATDALERDDISEVIPERLFITNWRSGSDRGALHNLKVTHIAAIGEEFLESEEDIEGITYYKHDIGDNEEEASKMGSSLREAADFIDEGIRGGGVALVHCAAGASRSATAVLAYQVLHGGMPLRAAFGDLWRRRPCTWPNDGFMASLIELELAKRGTTSLDLAEYVTWGDYEGPNEGGEEPACLLPVLMRLQRRDTCLGTELLAREAAEEQLAGLGVSHLGQLVAQRRASGGDATLKRLSRIERSALAQEVSGEARSSISERRKSSTISTASSKGSF